MERLSRRHASGVFPAPAGINRGIWGETKSHRRVPRASGDKPTAGMCLAPAGKCSPRQRG
ncbi:hypothetical protein IBL70_002269 [Salmonella enterica subsp. enterica serovar Ajiobo]|nr:hypothetical protein [Salmonella enterica subsp. enterica serovar Ajiobo]HAK1696203.1 hypothetical protein [Salmonella enterica]